jgi:hypothetical protein
LDQHKVSASTLPQLSEGWLQKMGFKLGEQMEILEAVKAINIPALMEDISRRSQGGGQEGEKSATIAGRFLSGVASAHHNWIFGEETSPNTKKPDV